MISFKTILGERGSRIIAEAIEDDILVKDNINSFTCKLCNTSMSGAIPAETHLQGAKHKKAVQNHYVGVNSEQSSSFASEDSSTSNVYTAVQRGLVSHVRVEGLNVTHYKCIPCNKQCTGLVPMNQHLISDSHAKKLRQDALSPMCSPYRMAPLTSPITTTTMQYDSASPPGASAMQGDISSITTTTTTMQYDLEDVQAAIASGLVSRVYTEGLNVIHYRCGLCNKQCTGLVPMNQHLISDSHAKKLRDEAMRLSFSPHKAAPSATSTSTNQRDNSPQPANKSSVQGDEVEQAMEEGIIRQADNDASHLKCCVCDIPCTGREAMKQHLQGKSHHKKQRALQFGVGSARSVTPEYYPTPSVSDTTPEDKTTIAEISSEVSIARSCISNEENGYLCNICKIVCNSHTQVTSHVQGEQHKKQLRLNLLLQRSSSPARAGIDTSHSPMTSTQANSAGCINVIPPPRQFEDPDIKTESPVAQKMEGNFKDYMQINVPCQITHIKPKVVPHRDYEWKNSSQKIQNLLSDIQIYMPDDNLSDLFDE